MAKRVQLSNGSFTVDSVRGTGTEVRASWSRWALSPAEQPPNVAARFVELAALSRDLEVVRSG